MSSEPTLWVWRHPRPDGAAGRCVGAGTDLPVHWRRAKRLARRIQRFARQQRLPRIVHTSPLRRCADVGRWLQRWGWQLQQDPALMELDFGRWDGQPWSAITQAEVDAWIDDFVEHRPGGGEALATLLHRSGAWQPGEGGVVVSHGGWMLARRWCLDQGQILPTASAWPTPPRYAECWRL